MTHESIPEHLLVLRLHAGTIHKSNPEQLLVVKAQRKDNPWVQSRTTPCFKDPRGYNPQGGEEGWPIRSLELIMWY